MNPRPRVLPEDFLRAQPLAADSRTHRQCGKLEVTLSRGYSYATGNLRKRSLHNRRRIPMLQVTQGRRAGLNYAASAKLLFVLAFLFNGYFLRGLPPRLAYLRSTHLSKPLRPHKCCTKSELLSCKKTAVSTTALIIIISHSLSIY